MHGIQEESEKASCLAYWDMTIIDDAARVRDFRKSIRGPNQMKSVTLQGKVENRAELLVGQYSVEAQQWNGYKKVFMCFSIVFFSC